MSVPDHVQSDWTTLTAEEKRARVLDVADALFAREGIDISVPDVARAVGVGVGSLYRQVGRKDDLVAALVVRRAEVMTARFAAAASAEDVAVALRAAVLLTVEDCVQDRVLQEAWQVSTHDPSFQVALGRLVDAMRALVEHAREAGVVRADATENDLRLAFRGVAAAEALHPGGARRLAELVLAGLAT